MPPVKKLLDYLTARFLYWMPTPRQSKIKGILLFQFNTAAAPSTTSSGTKTWLSKTLSSIKESATAATTSGTGTDVVSGREQLLKKSTSVDVIHNRGAPSSTS